MFLDKKTMIELEFYFSPRPEYRISFMFSDFALVMHYQLPIYCLTARAELQSAHPGLTRFG